MLDISNIRCFVHVKDFGNYPQAASYSVQSFVLNRTQQSLLTSSRQSLDSSEGKWWCKEFIIDDGFKDGVRELGSIVLGASIYYHS